MLKTIEHQHKRKAEILSREGSKIISKQPILILSKSGNSGTTVEVKTAAKFHGQITRDATGNVDLVAEMAKHADCLWLRVKAIEADAPNDNGDYFSREEIIKSYKSFEGVPVFTNHENSKVENAKGKVVKAEWDDVEGAVYCTMFIDKEANSPLCRAIEEGYVTDVSMGTQVDYSTCSVCENKAVTADSYCEHIRSMKGRSVEGKKVFEKNYGLKFIELSVVTDGACKDCTIREVIDPNDYLTRVASAINTVNRIMKIGEMTKDGGSAEIQKLNQAMDLLEDVSRTMLAQRQFIDLEFLNKVTSVLADLQHVNDELVDQGYGRIGNQNNGQQQMGIPPLPENQIPTQETANNPTNPVTTGPATSTGVGTVTEPATASSDGKVVINASKIGAIKDLTERMQKIYEETKLSRSGGDISTMDREKANQTIAKLAKIWENPSVKNYEGEFREGDFKILFTSDEIIGTRGGTKVASLKKTDLESDVREQLRDNPRQCALYLLDSLKTTFASVSPKTAGYAPTDSKAQQEETMEAQLASQKLPLHPRENEIRESTTEDQLRNKRDGYDYHARTEKSRDSITEAQLGDSMEGYDFHKRQDKPRDETTELQLRNKDWKGNATPADKGGDWVDGVSDQHQQITEGQLEDWKKADKTFNPTDRITEKQLGEDSENWGRRIASKEDALKAKTAAFKALAKTAIATGATPEELLSVIADFSASPRNQIAAERAVESLKKHKETRVAMFGRAKFHGSSKTASTSKVADFLLGSMSDEGMCGEVACQTLTALAEQKNFNALVSDAIANANSEAKPVKVASSKDFLREAMAELAQDEISIILKKEAIKADENDTEKFAAAAYDIATKIAEKRGFKVTAKIHVAKKSDGVEVALLGVKSEVKTEEPKQASIDIQARKDQRKEIVAQFGGAAPGGGDMGGGAAGGMPGPGGGTTMPPPPGGAGAPDPSAGVPPVAGLGAPEGGEDEGTGEALPPGSICPVCGSDNVDVRHGEFTCNDCGADGEIHVNIVVKEWPSVIEDTEPKDEDMGGEAAGGIGDMGGGAGMEMPGVGMQQAFRISPEMVKIAGSKPVGSFCPHCGSNKVKLAMKKGAGKGNCESCKGTYAVETKVEVGSKDLAATLSWTDSNSVKFAAHRAAEIKIAKKAESDRLAKKAALDQALRKAGATAKFASADLKGKAAIIADLADKNFLPKAE